MNQCQDLDDCTQLLATIWIPGSSGLQTLRIYGKESSLISTLRLENLTDILTACFHLHQGERLSPCRRSSLVTPRVHYTPGREVCGCIVQIMYSKAWALRQGNKVSDHTIMTTVVHWHLHVQRLSPVVETWTYLPSITGCHCSVQTVCGIHVRVHTLRTSWWGQQESSEVSIRWEEDKSDWLAIHSFMTTHNWSWGNLILKSFHLASCIQLPLLQSSC